MNLSRRLTPTELDVLARFGVLPSDLTPPKENTTMNKLIEKLAREHAPTVTEAPFPWFVNCPCGWKSRRVASRYEAETHARRHLMSVGADAVTNEGDPR